MSGIRCRDVTASYNGHPVLDGIHLDVAPGEWLAVIGPNGAGKSTLLKVISGAVHASGTVTIASRPIRSLGRKEAARSIAVVPQNPIIPGGMTVLDYVLLGRTPYISYWGTETGADVAVARRLIERLDLDTFATRTMGSLSGGERQRAVLARALAQEAEFLLLDEPTTALDLGHQQQVLDIVDGLRRERDVGVVSAVHDLTLAGQYADRLVLLDHGRVVAHGDSARVLTVDNLTRYYGASVTILRDADGTLVVAPRRS